MKLTFLGAAETVTGSKILFDHQNYIGMIDCGLFQGSKELRLRNWVDHLEFTEVEAIIITHAHLDHCGYIPRLYKNGFQGKIYCSKPTADLLKIMLLDAAKIQVEDAQYANKTHHSKHNPALPLYDEDDVLQALKYVHGVDWGKEIQLSHNMSFSLHRTGHILGSAYVNLKYIERDQLLNVIFSGDLGSDRSPLLIEPEKITTANAVVIESTYGNRKINRGSILPALEKCINDVMDRQGTLIIPAFSLGRAQDIMYLITQLYLDNRIKTPQVFLDSPMSHHITEIYQNYIQEMKPLVREKGMKYILSDEICHSVSSFEESKALVQSDRSKIVITASGMLQGGRVLHHLKEKLTDSRNGVLFIGFQALGTKGRLLKDGIGQIRIHHQDVKVNAEIFSIDGLSAHADSDELVGWLSNLNDQPKMIMINHGEPEASEALAYRLKNELKWDHVLVPKDGQTVEL